MLHLPNELLHSSLVVVVAGNADELTGVKQVQRRIREAGCEVLRVDHAGGMEEGHAKHGRADWG
ncbi:hypothetical protein DAI22_07g042700 [Oryza sativa Japonica Group]|jgi:hypothetical protein|nr:hypothetical protein DAI22_07g042700 [Oryza sativa Japonica Group]